MGWPKKEDHINKIEVQGQRNGHPKRSEASETDTQSDKNEALRILEGLRNPVGSRSPNRELRNYFLDGILLPNGDPVGVYF